MLDPADELSDRLEEIAAPITREVRRVLTRHGLPTEGDPASDAISQAVFELVDRKWAKRLYVGVAA